MWGRGGFVFPAHLSCSLSPFKMETGMKLSIQLKPKKKTCDLAPMLVTAALSGP